jgi:methionyl aminopeptidase
MQRGHCFTIEPMINAGQWTDTQWPDKWTAVTVLRSLRFIVIRTTLTQADGKRSAQFEQTLLCTDTGVDILTLRPTENGRPWFIDQLIKYKYAQAKEYL